MKKAKRFSFPKYTFLFGSMVLASFLLALAACFFLPDTIVVQWNGVSAVSRGSRFYIFILPCVNLILLCLYPVVRSISERYLLRDCFAPYITFALLVLVFSGEVYTILYAVLPYMPVGISTVIIVESIILIVCYLLFVFRQKGKNS